MIPLSARRILILLPEVKFSTTTRKIVEDPGLNWKEYSLKMIEKKFAYASGKDKLVFLGNLGALVPKEGPDQIFFKLLSIPQQVSFQGILTPESLKPFDFTFNRVEFSSPQKNVPEFENKGLEKMELDGFTYYINPQVELDASLVEDVSLGVSQWGSTLVTLKLNAQGTRKFARITKANVGKQLAIVYEGKLLMAPKIQEPILEGKVQITGGDMTKEDVAKMVSGLNVCSLLYNYQIEDAGFLTKKIWNGKIGSN